MRSVAGGAGGKGRHLRHAYEHIETGNTKLSLPVLAKIADELSVGVDALLSDAPKPDKAALSAEVQEILDSFEANELPVAIEVLRALRNALAKQRD